jgi:hypothetical protein
VQLHCFLIPWNVVDTHFLRIIVYDSARHVGLEFLGKNFLPSYFLKKFHLRFLLPQQGFGSILVRCLWILQSKILEKDQSLRTIFHPSFLTTPSPPPSFSSSSLSYLTILNVLAYAPLDLSLMLLKYGLSVPKVTKVRPKCT